MVLTSPRPAGKDSTARLHFAWAERHVARQCRCFHCTQCLVHETHLFGGKADPQCQPRHSSLGPTPRTALVWSHLMGCLLK